jgi:ubiquitin-protein ligase
LLSVISLLNEPNTFSPANVDASVMYRKWRDTKGKDDEYERSIRLGFYNKSYQKPPHLPHTAFVNSER